MTQLKPGRLRSHSHTLSLIIQIFFFFTINLMFSLLYHSPPKYLFSDKEKPTNTP